jgi:ureidoglycolate amidohydrolase
MTDLALSIDIERLMAELDHLAWFSDAPPPAVTRMLFSPPDLEARTWLKSLFADAGLTVRQDAVGNLFARWEGTDADASAVGTGSHTDAIPFSGRYDGTVGVLGALEAFRALRASGFEPRRPLEIVMFTSEEPTRFGLGCLGSRLLSGAWSPDQVAALRDGDGQSVDEVRLAVGCDGALADVPLPPGHYAAFVELHIEQGPLLEAHWDDIGLVTAIAAPATLRVEWEGKGGHAGAVLMPDRRDALPAAAELSLAVEAAAWATGSADTVATTGVFQVHPDAVNSIPSQVQMEIDVRDTDLSRRDNVVETIMEAAGQIAARRAVTCRTELLNADPPAAAAPEVVSAIQMACDSQGLSRRLLVSRAYHDSLFMSRIAPMGMIFIPCRGGVSHRSDEYSSPEQIRRGVETLARTLAYLAA